MNSRTHPKRTIVLAAMAAGLGACAGHGNAPEGGGDSPSRPSTAALQRIRGEAVVGKDGYGLTPCGGDRQRILALSTQAKGFIDRFQAPAGKPEFFLDAWAREQEGGTLEVVAVERAHTEGPRCGAAPEQAQFVAGGTEPFWSLRVASNGWRLERPDSSPLQATVAAERTGGAYVWSSAAPKAKVVLTPGYCADGMADAASAWQARIELGDARLTGCAHRGELALP